MQQPNFIRLNMGGPHQPERHPGTGRLNQQQPRALCVQWPQSERRKFTGSLHAAAGSQQFSDHSRVLGVHLAHCPRVPCLGDTGRELSVHWSDVELSGQLLRTLGLATFFNSSTGAVSRIGIYGKFTCQVPPSSGTVHANSGGAWTALLAICLAIATLTVL